MHSLFYYSITLIYLWAILRSCASVEPRHDVLGGANFGSRIFLFFFIISPIDLMLPFVSASRRDFFFFNCPERWYGGEALCALWSLKKKKRSCFRSIPLQCCQSGLPPFLPYSTTYTTGDHNWLSLANSAATGSFVQHVSREWISKYDQTLIHAIGGGPVH